MILQPGPIRSMVWQRMGKITTISAHRISGRRLGFHLGYEFAGDLTKHLSVEYMLSLTYLSALAMVYLRFSVFGNLTHPGAIWQGTELLLRIVPSRDDYLAVEMPR